jgi:hypothetical protein
MSKIEAFWENATADDVAGIANTRKSIAARARDEDTGHWRQVLLAGWKLARFGMGAIWIDADGVHWKHCQVYREPSWHANKPDPGPGFRLLEKFPDEDPQLGDSVFCPDSKRWLELEAGFDPGQLPTHWYRRRIEQLLSGHRWLANGDRLESGDLYYEKGVLLEVGREYWGNKVMLAEAFMRKIEQPEPEQIKLDEGSKCPIQGCSGVLRFRPVKDCACHIRPPCSHCEDNPPRCEACEWAIGDPVEPVEPGPQHYILRVGDSVETPSGDRLRCVEPSVEQRHYQLRATDTVGTPSGQTITITEKGFEVTQ